MFKYRKNITRSINRVRPTRRSHFNFHLCINKLKRSYTRIHQGVPKCRMHKRWLINRSTNPPNGSLKRSHIRTYISMRVLPVGRPSQPAKHRAHRTIPHQFAPNDPHKPPNISADGFIVCDISHLVTVSSFASIYALRARP